MGRHIYAELSVGAEARMAHRDKLVTGWAILARMIDSSDHTAFIWLDAPSMGSRTQGLTAIPSIPLIWYPWRYRDSACCRTALSVCGGTGSPIEARNVGSATPTSHPELKTLTDALSQGNRSRTETGKSFRKLGPVRASSFG